MTSMLSHIVISASLRVCNINGTLHAAEKSILEGDESSKSTEMLNNSLFGVGGLKDTIDLSHHMTEKVLDPDVASQSCPVEVGLDDGLQLTTNTAAHGKSAKSRGYRRWGKKRSSKGHPAGGPGAKGAR